MLAKFLIETVRSVRKAVGENFPVSLKLNSADFQKGGFSHEDAIQVATWLNEEGLDLLEISGGTYEQPHLVGIDMGLNPDSSPYQFQLNEVVHRCRQRSQEDLTLLHLTK